MIAAVAVILVAAVVVMQPNDDTAVDTTAAESSSTTEDATTTSSNLETTSTTATTEATTTTTTSTTAPPTTAPPTTTARPTTTAPPTTVPPQPAGPLDMSAVLAFAKAGVGGATAPYTYTGGYVCPAFANRPSDEGDDAVRDISYWELTRYCDGVYRAVLATTTDTEPLDSAWVAADTKPGGCSGIDVVVIGWHTHPSGGGTGGGGAVVATPGCDRASWRWVDAAGFPTYNGSWLQLDFRGSALGDPSAFDWRGAVRAAGENGGAIDMVPNGGPEHFVV